MCDGRYMEGHIFSTIESMKRTQLTGEECPQLRCTEYIGLMNVPNCAELNAGN